MKTVAEWLGNFTQKWENLGEFSGVLSQTRLILMDTRQKVALIDQFEPLILEDSLKMGK